MGTRKKSTINPFMFLSQAQQVFYVQDSKQSEWSRVVFTKARDLYDIGVNLQVEADDTYP